MPLSGSTTRRVKGSAALLLASCLAVVTLLTFGLGFWAIEQSRQASQEAAETRGEEAVALLNEALQRDMTGGQTSVLLPLSQPMVTSGTLYDLADEFARGFARFPYLESFFVWRRNGDSGATYFFVRSDRKPSWEQIDAHDVSYPVEIRQDPAAMRPLIARTRDDATRQIQFAAHEFSISGVRYQAFSRIFYEGYPASKLSAIAGFVVDLDWVRLHYFDDFISQMQMVIGDRAIGVRVVDGTGATIATVGPPMASKPNHARRFPLLFMNRALADTRDARAAPDWTVQVDATHESLSAAGLGATWVLMLFGLATLLTFAALALTVRATAASARLALAQSDFVSTVTHDMKTPLALIRLASDTLATGRYDSKDTIPDYGRLLATEAGRLTRLIDNALSAARSSNPASRYHFERTDVVELLEECVNSFRPESTAAGLAIRTELPAESADVCADRAAMRQVFDNLVDNALRHAASGHALTATVRRSAGTVSITFADSGPGIPEDDLARIFDKFYRGRNAGSRGSGLGLAIVRQIVASHGGSVEVESLIGRGTTLRVVLPVWAAWNEGTDDAQAGGEREIDADQDGAFGPTRAASGRNRPIHSLTRRFARDRSRASSLT
jgi:signal transduction histidine kinase